MRGHTWYMFLQSHIKGQGWGRSLNHQVGLECIWVTYLLLYIFQEYMSFSSDFCRYASVISDIRLTNLTHFDCITNNDINDCTILRCPQLANTKIDRLHAFIVRKNRSTGPFIGLITLTIPISPRSGSPVYQMQIQFQMAAMPRTPKRQIPPRHST